MEIENRRFIRKWLGQTAGLFCKCRTDKSRGEKADFVQILCGHQLAFRRAFLGIVRQADIFDPVVKRRIGSNTSDNRGHTAFEVSVEAGLRPVVFFFHYKMLPLT